jgi:Ca2+-binding EF-hand superfamily protein
MFHRLYSLFSISKSTPYLRHSVSYATDIKAFTKATFDRLDIYKKGELTQTELLYALAGIAATNRTAYVDRAFRNIDHANKGVITIDELENYLKTLKMPKDELLRIDFDLMDTNNDGEISIHDWNKFFECVRMPWFRSLIQAHFVHIDSERTGKLSLDQYINWCRFRFFVQHLFGLHNDYKKYM